MRRFHGTMVGLLCLVFLVAGMVPIASAEHQSLLDEVQKRGVLRVGCMLDFPPLGWRDEKGNPKGFNVRLAEEMAKALGVKLEIIETVSANRIPALVAKRIDVSSAGLTITTERAKAVDFTIPDRRGAMFVLTHADSPIKTLDDCKDYKIGTVRGTTPEIYFLNYFKDKGIKIDYISYDSNADQLLALKQKKVDAIAETDIWFGEVMAKFPGKFKIVRPGYFNEWTGLAVRHGDFTWLHWINTWLWDMHITGKIKQLHKEFNMPYIPVKPAYE
ncbi:MAG: transporter substrate-binding domain-containing protein [Deltaproteobacteria bacterium]|nr:transporter substrate-binding domain-containing protein [Deltaproteobacteria bacterium]MBW2122433.1 transporter substrate-binding domain-containing protein [Deltaproteobacteria bacterium]